MRKMLLCAMVVGVLLATVPAGAAEKSKPPIQLDVFAGFDYDSNVNLRSSEYDVRTFQPKGDAALYKHQAQVGYNFAFNPKFSLLAQYTYYQDFHFRLTEYDNMSHNVTLSPTLNVFGNTGQLIAMCNFNYLTIGGNDYKTGWTFMPTYYQMLAQKVMLEIGGLYEYGTYYAPIVIDDDDRTGSTVGLAAGLFYFFNDARTGYLQLRYSPIWTLTEGSNFYGVGHKFQLAAMIPATKQLNIRPYISYAYYPYFNNWVNASAPTLNIYSKREDSIVEGGVQVTYKFAQGFYVEGQYNFTAANSNIAFYQYNRHVVGGKVGYRF